jgi:hypothetical protein
LHTAVNDNLLPAIMVLLSIRMTQLIAALCLPVALVSQEPAQGTATPTALRPSIGAHFGFVSLDDARNTLEVGLLADLGSYRYPWLRTVAGLDYLNSRSTRPGADGSFTDVSLNLDIRIMPFSVQAVTPYLGVGPGVHFRSTTASDPNVANIYDGTVVGWQAFIGALVDLADDRSWGALAELRTTQAQNIDRKALRVGAYRRF